MEMLLQKILDDCRQHIAQGKVANYIPALAEANIDEFGICTIDKNAIYCCGDHKAAFTMQSIIKPVILLMALMDNGADAVRELGGTAIYQLYKPLQSPRRRDGCQEQ